MKKTVFMGLLVVLLAFGFIGWDDENDKSTTTGNGLPENLNTNNPGNSLQSGYNLSETKLSTLMNAPGGGFAGWITIVDEDDTEILQLYWTGRNTTQCYALITAIRALPNTGDDYGPETIEGAMISATGSYQSGAYRYSVIFSITDLVIPQWGIDYPPGILVVNFWEEED